MDGAEKIVDCGGDTGRGYRGSNNIDNEERMAKYRGGRSGRW